MPVHVLERGGAISHLQLRNERPDMLDQHGLQSLHDFIGGPQDIEMDTQPLYLEEVMHV